MSNQAVCFVDMPFGKKKDLLSGVLIDFDVIYNTGIKPAIEEVGLKPERGDQEQSGGIIHLPMFARILLSDFMVADLTLGNPNVFYELGIRHLAKPFTTVPIFATTSALPFDVASVRSIGYDLKEGMLEAESAARLRRNIADRLRISMQQAAKPDSPIYDLINALPPPAIPEAVERSLTERIDQQSDFRVRLGQARGQSSDRERTSALKDLQRSLGPLGATRRGILLQLMIAYRDVSAFAEMIELYEELPDDLRSNPIIQQQFALGLNRRREAGDQDRAAAILQEIVARRGPDPETLGLIGRIHKDRYKAERAKPEDQRDELALEGHLDAAIDAYRKGFESDPRDYYPGINVVTLLIHRGTPDSLAKAEKFLPVLKFALDRRATSTGDYWDLATLLEAACCERDWTAATQFARRALAVVQSTRASFMARSTLENLELLREGFARSGQGAPELEKIITSYGNTAAQLRGEDSKTG
jgi:tetratricopeptide (TPR) repeat protein